MRTGTSAHLPVFGVCAVRGPPGPQLGFARGRDADGDVRAPPSVRRLRGARTSRSAIGLRRGRDADEDVRAPPGVRRLRGARTSRCSAAARCAGLPVRNRASHEAGMRTRTSAHLPVFGACAVRGPPGPHWASREAGMRTRTSAHLPVFGGCAVRGPPGPQLGFARGRDADEDVRAPPGVRRLRGARTSRNWASAIGLRTRPGCGRGRPRTSRCSASARCADLPVRNWASREGRNADEDVRAPPGVRRLRGARTSRSATGLRTRPGCGRGRPRTSRCSAPARCADLPVRNWASHEAGMRTRTSAHLPVFGACAVRGPPGPQLGFARGRDADEDVRAPPVRISAYCTAHHLRGTHVRTARVAGLAGYRPGA